MENQPWAMVTTAAATGTQKLMLEFTAPVDGYMYIYVANETDDDINVYFDNLTITHTGLQVVEQTDYYPYGMVMRKELPSQGQGVYSRYRHGYQGQFAEKDEETGWNHFEARDYNPIIGRWSTTDPKRAGFSSYWSMNNNPIYYVDPDGRCPDCEFIENPFEGQSVSFGYRNDIAEYIYSGGDWLRIGGLLNEVVITPSGWDNTLDFGSSAAIDGLNSVSFILSATTMPIINQFGGGDVDWAKVYTFDANWNYNGRNLDDGNLSVEEMNEVMHNTVGFLTYFAPSTTVIKTGMPFVDKLANYLIVTTGKTVVKKTVDYSIDYHK